MSKGPSPPNRLPTLEEQQRGPRQSDYSHDWRHYVYGSEQVAEYHRTGKLKAKTPKRVVQLISYFGGR